MNYMANVTRSAGDPQIISTGPSSLAPADRLARALGWFSIGLGAAELLMPETVCRTAPDLYAERFRTSRFRTSPRFLEHHLASDLLVSREAIRWRLRGLSLTSRESPFSRKP